MKAYSLTHLSDQTLLHDLAALIARDRATTARLLAHLAEVDARKLYLPAAYPSMFAWCVGELRLSEDAAFKRIKAARAARRFPAIFAAVADGRLHLSAVVLMAPHLTEDTAHELLAAAAHRSKSEIGQLLAERFPRPDLIGWVATTPESSATTSPGEQAPGPVELHIASGDDEDPRAPGCGTSLQAPGPVAGRSRVEPLAPRSFAVQFTLSQGAHDKLCHAQELLGHQVPDGDLAVVVERALDSLIERLEKRRFAATSAPRQHSNRPNASRRHVPGHVRRAVWERDGGRCTFESGTGHRCPARARLEFDHIEPLARGGEATAENVRLRCRAHNQYTAECVFGAGFMSGRREEAARARAAARAARSRMAAEPSSAGRPPRGEAGDGGDERDVIPWLRQLGFRADEARRAAARCDAIPHAPLDERLRLALRHLTPPHRRVAASLATPARGSGARSVHGHGAA